MSRARTLAGAIGSDGALNVADVAGLAAVASSGSASDLTTGSLPVARLPNAGSELGLRNRIINGDMRIDQRNNGAAVLNSANFSVDRWSDAKSGSGQYSAQRSTIAPAGFVNSLLHTVTTAVTPAATDVYQTFQPIEGFNASDLGWGTASAQAVTISFWVRSSITGTYAVSVMNGGSTRSYVATYTVNSANTFEYKTVTIPGDTTGTWVTDNTVWAYLVFDLGSGSNLNTTAGAWQAGGFKRTSACVSLISTNGATFYITGVQLEAGSVATPFERRPFGTELALCQRYYQNVNYGGTWYTGSTGVFVDMEDAAMGGPQFFVPMRATPTFNLTADGGATQSIRSWGGNALRTVTEVRATPFGISTITHDGGYTLGRSYTATWRASAEL